MKKFLITLITFAGINLLHSQTFPTPGNFTLPAGKSIVITYDVDVNADVCPEDQIPVMDLSNQATVSGSNFGNVLTDDPDIGGTTDPTLTPFAGHVIGDLVFHDVNRNGIFDLGDAGISGVVVNLYRDVNSNNMLDVMDGAPIGMTSTGIMPAGAYSFSVCPGTYMVEIAPSNFTMGGVLYNSGDPFVSSPIGGAPDPDVSNTDGDDNGDQVVGFGVASAAFSVSSDRNDIDFALKTPTTVTINDVTMSEGTAGSSTSFSFSVQRSDNQESFSLTVNTMDGTATVADQDYSAISGGTVMFTAAGNLIEMVTVQVNHDHIVEAAESFIVELSEPPSGVAITDGTGLGTINNDDMATVTLTGTASQNEGSTFAFTATLDNPVQGGFMVSYATSDGTATTTDVDYTDNNGTLTFDGTVDEIEIIMVSSTEDQKVEQDETFNIALGTISGGPAGVLIGGSTQTGTILNNDQTMVTISDVSEVEGDMGMQAFVFDVSLSHAVQGGFHLSFSAVDGTATDADDFDAPITPLIFDGTVNETQTITIQVNGDEKVEDNEAFTVTLNSLSMILADPADISFSGSPATGIITNDDSAILTLTGGGASDEGNTGTNNRTITATLDKPVQDGFTISYLTSDGTAEVLDDDYEENVGFFTFSGIANETQMVDLIVNGDLKVEMNESFALNLGSITSTSVVQAAAITLDNQELITITNDEIDFGDSPETYGTSIANMGAQHGTAIFGFHLGAMIDGDLDGQPTANGDGDDTDSEGDDDDGVTIPGLIVDQNSTIVVNATAAGKLDAWIDWEADGAFDVTDQIATNLSLVAGNNNLNVAVPSSAVEGTTFARFRLSSDGGLGPTGAAPNGEVEDYQVTISNVLFDIDDPTVMEGNINTTNLVFTVTRNNNGSNVSVDYSITGGTATTADNDYQPLAAGSLMFTQGGSLSMPVTVTVNGDNKVESDETVFMTLSNPVGAGIDDGQGIGMITNDDQATLTISNPLITEGSNGTTNAVFAIALSNPADSPITFNYSTQDGTATVADNDYQGMTSQNGGLLTGEQLLNIMVPVNGDCAIEPDEMFSLILSDIVSGSDIIIPSNEGQATIQNDDAAPVISCPASLTHTVPCNTNSKVIALPIPVTTNICGTSSLEFHYRTVNAMNTPTGAYTAFAPSGSATLPFSLGRYEVEWQITDASGVSVCSYYLQVREMSINTPVIQGPTVICPALTGLSYSVTPQEGVESYQWSYSGSGVTIHNNGSAAINLDFAEGATAGTLMVTVVDPCGGPDAAANLNISLGNSVTCAFVNCLLSNLLVTDNTLILSGMPQVFKIGGQISSNANVQSPNTITFKAAEEISLLPQFQVSPGAVFIAEIESCPVVFPFGSGR